MAHRDGGFDFAPAILAMCGGLCDSGGSSCGACGGCGACGTSVFCVELMIIYLQVVVVAVVEGAEVVVAAADSRKISSTHNFIPFIP